MPRCPGASPPQVSFWQLPWTLWGALSQPSLSLCACCAGCETWTAAAGWHRAIEVLCLSEAAGDAETQAEVQKMMSQQETGKPHNLGHRL